MINHIFAACLMMAAQTYSLPPQVLIGILHVEGGNIEPDAATEQIGFDAGFIVFDALVLDRGAGRNETRRDLPIDEKLGRNRDGVGFDVTARLAAMPERSIDHRVRAEIVFDARVAIQEAGFVRKRSRIERRVGDRVPDRGRRQRHSPEDDVLGLAGVAQASGKPQRGSDVPGRRSECRIGFLILNEVIDERSVE